MRFILLAAIFTASAAYAQDGVASAWETDTIIDPMTDAVRGIANTKIDDPITLLLKCDRNGDGSVYFTFYSESYLGGIGDRLRYVKYRFDGGEPQEMMASHSDHSATGTYLTKKSSGVQFLKRLMVADQMVVQLTDFNDRVYTQIIDVTGAREAFNHVVMTCKDERMGKFMAE